ncbi:MAG TPA: IS1182 family transposase [Terracidiphilus sp.]|nr:IS1182 family transposase [Terracidiphilus sp.]
MSRFKVYSPDQAYLLPPSVRDELGEKHLCFFVREVIERLDMSVFQQSYSQEGGELYAPQLMLGVWLYAYALGITSARQVARRLVEDLAFRYLAAGERVDNWALSAFRRRHGRALNDAFTQVLEWAQGQGMAKLGRVAIDSTRIAANASRDRVDSEQALRETRARLRRQVRAWQKEADRDDAEPGGLEVAIAELNQALAEMPRRLERLKKSGLKKLSRTDKDARFMRQRGDKFVLGYSAEIAVSDNHLIVAQRVTQNVTDNASLGPMLDQVEQRCGAPPGVALADSGFFSITNLEQMEQRNIDAYVPDSNMARALNLGTRCRTRACAPAHRRMRAKLRSPAGQAAYARRKAVVEPVFGVLKQQRGIRQFRTRGLNQVGNEFTLATMAFNITRLHAMRAA